MQFIHAHTPTVSCQFEIIASGRCYPPPPSFNKKKTPHVL